MEKYNEAEILRDIRHCVYDGDFDRAMEYADQLDIHKIKNISSLCLLGEVYLEKEKYETAEEILSKAYARAPKGRRLLDLLTTLYIDKKDYVQAEYYYKEFISAASKDLHRYVLRYRLDKGKGERLSVLIHTLEQLKDYEYIEEWAYELAALYHEAGEDKKCVRECDEIVLWFGQGEYVDKAIRLKCQITGEPLPDRLQPHPVTTPDAGRTVGATYMFDSEGILANTGLNTALDVDAFMREEDGESASLADAGEETGGAAEKAPEKTGEAAGETGQDEARDEADADKDAGADDGMAEAAATEPEEAAPQEAPLDDATASGAEDKETISALYDEMVLQPMKEEEKEAAEEKEEPEPVRKADIVERIQKNMRGRWINRPAMQEIFPDADGADEEDEVIEEDDALPAQADGLIQEDEDEIIKEKEIDPDLQMFFGETLADEAPAGGEEGQAVEDSAEKPSETEAVPEEPAEESAAMEDTEDRFEDEDEILTDDISIPDTVMDIFATAADIRDVKKQLAQTFTKLESSLLEKEDILAPYDINFVVSGNDDSMKSQISIGIAKALNTYGLCDKQKIVGASAQQLNAMDFAPVFDKITGGCLIISKAGQLSQRSIQIIKDYVEQPDQKVAIVLEDSQDNLLELWKANKELRSKFLNVINIAKYDERELVKLAESYAKRKGYDISEEARMVTLREIFEKRMLSGGEVGYEDVMAVVDEAIINLEKRNMKNLFMTVLDNAYKEASMFTLLPEDFA